MTKQAGGLTYDPHVTTALNLAVDGRAVVGQPSGIGVYLNAVLRGLADKSDVTSVVMAHAPLSGLPDDLAVTRSVESSFSGVWWQQTTLSQQLAKHQCNALWSPVFTLPWNPGVPSVITVHDMTPWIYPGSHRLKVLASIRPLFARSARLAKRIITPSAHAASDLIDRHPALKRKVRVIAHGVDPAFQPASDEQIAATRQQLGLEDGYLLFGGTIEPRKNLDSVLDVWQPLFEQGQALPLVIVGPVGWKSQSTVKRMDELRGRGLHYLGALPRPEQVATFQAATTLVFPSLYEGFGFPALEAMACGVPVISSNRSSLPEVVADAGILVDPTDRTELGSAVRRILTNHSLAQDLGQRGLEQSRKFTWARSVDQHLEVFRETAAETS